MKKKSHKKPIWYATSFWVHGYIYFYIVMTVLAVLPRLLAPILYWTTGAVPTWVPEQVTIPLEVFSWGLLIITSAYAGLDRASFAVKSTMTEVGTSDMGDPKKLRKVIVWLFLIFVESYALNFVFGKPFDYPPDAPISSFPGANIPLTEVASALVSAITIYVGGNKAIRLVANTTDGKKFEGVDTSEATIVNDVEQPQNEAVPEVKEIPIG